MSKKKKKKKLIKKINPERSNKMIIAVVVGLVIVFASLFIVFTSGHTPENKEEAMKESIKYLENDDFVIEIKYFPEQSKVVIVYDANADQTKIDLKKIIQTAAQKLSYSLADLEVSVALVSNKDKSGKEEYAAFAKDGQLLRVFGNL